MPRRRPAVPIPGAPASPNRAKKVEFIIDTAYPRSGVRKNAYWVDTGIFLALGASPNMLSAFRAHFLPRSKTAKSVDLEVRGIGKSEDPGRTSIDVKTAASTALASFFVGARQDFCLEVPLSHAAMRDEVKMRLAGLSDGPAHSGETDLIVLAFVRSQTASVAQVLLANDAGASVVANSYNLTTRNMGDIFAEIVCLSDTVEPTLALREFKNALAITGLAQNVRGRTLANFSCRRDGGECASCLEGSQ